MKTQAGSVELRYVARAGLLPELTRQTYDSLYKSLREVVLNSLDAAASQVSLDLARVQSDRVMEVRDNGSGMTLDELQQSFMSLGGSTKFSARDKYGRIGIGSLALMRYAKSVHVETKTAGSPFVTRASVSHPWALDQHERVQDLGDFLAGRAWQEAAPPGTRRDHYTGIRLEDVDDLLVNECTDVSACYRLIDRLRRVLPLPWRDTLLSSQLARVGAEANNLISQHTAEFSAQVIVRSHWGGGDEITKQVYGEGTLQEESWNGSPRPILRDVEVDREDGIHTLRLVGYLLSQVRPSTDWSGITARVQNVAVEERTFFDLETDPGFRKYVTGELWILGDVDRAHLINIDRASFNRESPDYQAIARVMQSEISQFKAERVQAPQRAKVAIKRRLDRQIEIIKCCARITQAVTSTLPAGASLPSSNNGSLRPARARTLLDDLRHLGAVVAVAGPKDFKRRPYELKIAADGRRVLVEVSSDLANPSIDLTGTSYELSLVEASPNLPPVVLKKRPREIVFNLGHPAFDGDLREAAFETVLALELGFLLGTIRPGAELYDDVLEILSRRGRRA